LNTGDCLIEVTAWTGLNVYRKHKENLIILWFYLRWKLIENNETKK
jgi:hypothetical protein